MKTKQSSKLVLISEVLHKILKMFDSKILNKINCKLYLQVTKFRQIFHLMYTKVIFIYPFMYIPSYINILSMLTNRNTLFNKICQHLHWLEIIFIWYSTHYGIYIVKIFQNPIGLVMNKWRTCEINIFYIQYSGWLRIFSYTIIYHNTSMST